jgi:hypothetical protein
VTLPHRARTVRTATAPVTPLSNSLNRFTPSPASTGSALNIKARGVRVNRQDRAVAVELLRDALGKGNRSAKGKALSRVPALP